MPCYASRARGRQCRRGRLLGLAGVLVLLAAFSGRCKRSLEDIAREQATSVQGPKNETPRHNGHWESGDGESATFSTAQHLRWHIPVPVQYQPREEQPDSKQAQKDNQRADHYRQPTPPGEASCHVATFRP